MGESALPTSKHSHHNRYILMDIRWVGVCVSCACGIALYLFENILQIKWRALVHTNSNIDLKFVDVKMWIVCPVKIFHQPYFVIYYFFSLHVLFLRHLICPFIVFSPMYSHLALLTAHTSNGDEMYKQYTFANSFATNWNRQFFIPSATPIISRIQIQMFSQHEKKNSMLILINKVKFVQ